MIKLSIADAPDRLRMAVRAVKLADKDIRKAITAGTRELNPVWKKAVADQVSWRPEGLILNQGVRIAAGNPPALVAAGTTRPVTSSRRLAPASSWWAYEYGADRNSYSTYGRKSKRGVATKVKRRVNMDKRQRRRQGRVLEPAAAQTLPRLASYWWQACMRAWLTALEEGQT